MTMVDNRETARLQKVDRIMLVLLLAHLPVTMFMVPMGYGTSTFAMVWSAANALLAGLAYMLLQGTRGFGMVAAMSLLVYSAIMIQSQLGRIEMHFHIFVALAVLLIYRDWMIIGVAAVVGAVHHVLLTAMQLSEVTVMGLPVKVFNYDCSWSITFLHAAFVVVEAAALGYFAILMEAERKADSAMINAVNRISRENDLKVRLSEQDAPETAKDFNNMVAELSTTMAYLVDAGKRLLATSETMQRVGNQSQESLLGQQQRSDQVAASTHQMVESIHEVARHATEAADTASRVAEDIRLGNQVVQDTVTAINKLNHGLADTAESVKTLEQKTQAIGSVLDVIRNVSEQTNLLALNAAIEAARAGEQGRGFAVVADEVRLLAQRTQESTEEIRRMIEALQQGARQAVAAMNVGQEQVADSTELVHKAGEALEAISGRIATMNDINTQVAAASEEQGLVANEINSNVQNMHNVLRSLSEGGHVVLETSRELVNMASEVNIRVSRYRT